MNATMQAAPAPGRQLRIAVVVTHPIQYFVPLYRALASTTGVQLKVLYCSRIGLEKFHDPGMGVELAWSMDLLGGYDSAFLARAEKIKSLGWSAVDNPDVGGALAAFAPDAVIINGYARRTLLRALVWCRRRGVPAIMMSDSSMNASPGRLRSAVKGMIVPRLLRQFSAMLTMSERSEDYFRAQGVPPERLFRVPVMLDDVFWRAQQRWQSLREEARARLGYGASDLVLLYVGKLYPSKRVSDIVAAMAGLRHLPLRLLVVGDGDERAALVAQAKSVGVSAEFTGFVNIDSLAPYYCAGDILAHPASIEQFGMIAVEAAILGLPMILSDRVGAIGATSVARTDVNALVYPCGDVAALAASVERLATDDRLRARMGERSLAIAEDHRGPKSVAGIIGAVDFVSAPLTRPNSLKRTVA